MEFSNEPAAVAVKHMNPCGVGIGSTIEEAFQKAYDADPISIFGGIIALNREVDLATAKKLKEIFLEIIIAPSFAHDALELLKEKPNLRLLETAVEPDEFDSKKVVSVRGGLLESNSDLGRVEADELELVTEQARTREQLGELLFARKVVKHVKSNH